MRRLVHDLVPSRDDGDKADENAEETKNVRPWDVCRIKQIPNEWHAGEYLRKVHSRPGSYVWAIVLVLLVLCCW